MRSIRLVFFLLFFLCHSRLVLSANHEKLWFQGSVEEAIKLGYESHKPLFFYWGAVWCPPCNLLKRNVFSTELFNEEIQHFIPVYLNGDLPMAQRWGEKLNSSGYPTVMVLEAVGPKDVSEMARLSVTDPKAFVEALKSARLSRKDIGQRVKMALENPEKITVADWQALAGYSWQQIPDSNNLWKSDSDKAEILRKLFDLIGTKDKISKSVFFFHLVAIDKEKKSWKGEREYFMKILEDSEIVAKNIETLAYESPNLVEGFSKDKKDTEQLQKNILETMEKMRSDVGLTNDEKLSSYLPAIEFNKMSKIDIVKLKEFIATLDKMLDPKDEQKAYERQGVMSSAIYLLEKAKLNSLAIKYAKNEIKKSHSPYYFMSYLAGILKEQGKTKEALKWWRKSWIESTGPATRIQWGTSYLGQLMKIASHDPKRVWSDLELYLDESLKDASLFEGRNGKRMERLQKSFQEWYKLTGKSKEKDLTKLKVKCEKSASEIKIKCLEYMGSLFTENM